MKLVVAVVLILGLTACPNMCCQDGQVIKVGEKSYLCERQPQFRLVPPE